ncbi:MAG: phosphoadenylyl-sulfate reductase [Vicinamibacterales bacterium]
MQTSGTTDKVAVREEIGRLLPRLEAMTAEEIVRWALERYGQRLALASSFGAEDVVVIDMMMAVDRRARVVTLDTGRLPQETYSVIDAVRERYGLHTEVFFPKADDVQQMVSEKGLNLFYHSIENRKLCCAVRKLEPLGRALSGLEAWMTGLRRVQNVTRTIVGKVEWDEGHQLVKVNPLADWSWDEVWKYIRTHNVPYNALHDRGFPSIGCAPCTRAIQPGEDLRAGRWWWEHPTETKECGLHVKDVK